MIQDIKKKIIIVLGMHRSGTSAITRALQTMGVNLGDRLMPPVSGNNDKGFWEDIDFNALNIEILNVLGSDWHHVTPIAFSDKIRLRKQGYFLRAVELLRSKVFDVPVFGFKDPRVAKLLPFWKEVITHCQYDVCFVLSLRNPLSVVKSLSKRDNFYPEKSYLLWLEHVINSLSVTVGAKRVLVDYDLLMKFPDRELARIARGLNLDIDQAELDKYKSEFLDEKLRHTVYTPRDLDVEDSCPSIVREIYAALWDVASGIRLIDDAELQCQVEEWVKEVKRLNPLMALVDKCSSQEINLNQSMIERDGQITGLNQAVVERDGRIAGLNHAVVERDEQIAGLNQSLVERDGRIAGLNQSLVERDGRIAGLNHAVVERDEQIAGLNQSLVERDGRIAGLNQSLVERDGRIAGLNHAVVERDEQIAGLNQSLVERDEYITSIQRRESELRNEIGDIRLTKSWRVTKPLRELSRRKQGIMRFIRLYQNYRKTYPGFSGFRRLASRSIDAIRNGGVNCFRSRVALYERRCSTALQIPSGAILVLEDIKDKVLNLPTDVAVHAHIYYPDLASEIRSYLENIPVKFHFYVTTDTIEKAKQIQDSFLNIKNIQAQEIYVTENRGRDIFPMLVAMGDKLVEHEIVLHIHTKRSPHNSWVLGGWRRFMMESLLGNSQRVTAILQQFVQNKNLGIFFPDPYHPVKPYVQMISNANDNNMEILLCRAGKRREELNNIDRTFFPAGDMFWFRGKAIKPFIDMKLTAHDFESEEGQVDATLAHAIERMFPYFAAESGLITKSYFSNSFFSQQCSASRFDLFRSYTAKGLINNPTLLFDHNIGGGANTYTREFVKTVLMDDGEILRVYNSDGIWFVQWIANGDGMLFYTQSIKELFKELSISHCTRIILNSLYGCPDIGGIITEILKLSQELKIPIDIKIHDFFALCPSPHLSNFEGEYCGVPQEHSDCRNCLKSNTSWYTNWYPKKNRPVDIDDWRQPFVRLVEEATTVTFFDNAPIEIFRRVFHLEDSKIMVVPHKVDYFKCDRKMDLSGPLHIGILGTLTNIKGGKIVVALSDYIDNNGLGIRITILGPTHIDTPPHINVHGPYEPNHLPDLVRDNGINVILAPSIVPETFGYTISEAINMGLPIVAFDIGAQGSRVKQYAMGKVVPLGSAPEVLLTAIQSALKTAKEIKK